MSLSVKTGLCIIVPLLAITLQTEARTTSRLASRSQAAEKGERPLKITSGYIGYIYQMQEEMEPMMDSRSSLRAIKQRFQNIPPGLKTKIDERDNDGIINFIQTDSSNINENFKVNILASISRVNKHCISSVLFYSWPSKMTRRLLKQFWAGVPHMDWPRQLEKMTGRRDTIPSLYLANMISKPAWSICTSMGTGWRISTKQTKNWTR